MAWMYFDNLSDVYTSSKKVRELVFFIKVYTVYCMSICNCIMSHGRSGIYGFYTFRIRWNGLVPFFFFGRRFNRL